MSAVDQGGASRPLVTADRAVLTNETDPTRVLLLTSRLSTMGGSEKHLSTLARHLSRHRFRVWVRSLAPGAVIDGLHRDGIDAASFDVGSLFSVAGLVSIRRLARWMREMRFDVVMSYHEDADIVNAIAGTVARVPVLISTRRDMGFMTTKAQRWVLRALNRRFTRIIAVSEAVKKQVVAAQWVPEALVSIAPNGVLPGPPRAERTDALHRLLGLPVTAPIVGMVASFRPVKRQDVFVRAAARVLRSHPHAEFVIVGYLDTPYFHDVTRLMDELGVRKKIHCLGKRDDVPELLRSMDLFVLSSEHEGSSNAILEAMDAGLPIVAPASGGNPEVVSVDVGILVPPGDAEALAVVIEGLLADPARRVEMGRAARATASETFSEDAMVIRYQSLIESEVARRRGAPAPLSGTGVSASCRS